MNFANISGVLLAVALASPLAARTDPPTRLTDVPLSSADAARIAGEAFDVLDVHKMGWISSRAGRLYQITDLNSDGQVTKPEFVRAAGLRFEQQDTNHDGQVTKDERSEFQRRAKERRIKELNGEAPAAPER